MLSQCEIYSVKTVKTVTFIFLMLLLLSILDIERLIIYGFYVHMYKNVALFIVAFVLKFAVHYFPLINKKPGRGYKIY